MTALVPSPAPGPQWASNRATVSGNRPPRGAITCNGCHDWWSGLGAAHCSSCHQTFTGVSAFEMHCSGSHARGTRHCLDPATVRLGEDRRTPARPRRQTMGGLVPAGRLERTRRMTVSTETRASCRNLRRTTPPPNATALITPTPQTAEPRCGVGRRHDVRQIHWPASRLQAAGNVPELSVEPSMEAQREAAEIIERQSRDILG
jgi:hypothetical protein